MTNLGLSLQKFDYNVFGVGRGGLALTTANFCRVTLKPPGKPLKQQR
jgi:hypothetical protein